MTGHALKAMKLYDQVERVFNELHAAGIRDEDPIPVELLCSLDQYHYHGTTAVDFAFRTLGLGPGDRVLDVGAGIGGPARHLASRVGCHVTAIELQPDLNDTAAALTRRCGLEARIEHRCADFLDTPLPAASFDALMSWLVFLHIPDRPTLYRRCAQVLEPSGSLFVEDYFQRRPFSPKQREDLRVKIQCPSLPSFEDYASQLGDAGFVDVELTDMTANWTAFVTDRARAYQAGRERHIAMNGQEIFDGLDDFYATVAALFDSGNLGGIRVRARKR